LIQEIAVSLAFLFLALRLVRYTAIYASNLLIKDEGIYFAPFIKGGSPWSLIDARIGVHFQGPVNVLAGWLLEWSHWNTRTLSFALTGSFVLAAGMFLILKRKYFGTLTLADVTIPLLFLTLWQTETILFIPNLSYGMPALLFVFTIWLWASLKGWRRFLAIALASVLMIFTDYGYLNAVTIIVMLVVEMMRFRREIPTSELLSAAIVLSLIVGVLAFVYVSDNFLSDHIIRQYPTPSLRNQFLFAFSMLSNSVGMDWGSWNRLFPGRYLLPAFIMGALIGFVGIGLLIYQTLKFKRARLSDVPRELMVVGCLLNGILYAAAVTIGRARIGLDASQWTRYYTGLIFLLLGIYLAVYCMRRSSLLRNLALFVLFALLLRVNLPSFPKEFIPAFVATQQKEAWRNCYRKYESLQRCNEMTNFCPICFSADPASHHHHEDPYKELKEKQRNVFWPPS
jgi:hypothetical protein